MSAAARAACGVVFMASAASAVTAQPVTGSSPSQAPIELHYQSTFEGYRRFSDEKVGSWREANDNVGRIGGWREYAKEAQQPDAGAAGAKSPAGTGAAPATRDPHAGHEKH